MDIIQEDHDSNKGYALITIGGTGADFLKAYGVDVSHELEGLTDQPMFEEVRKVVTTATAMCQNEVFGELYICYNHHANPLTSQFCVEKMPSITDLDLSEAASHEQEYPLEPLPETTLGQLLLQYMKSLIYGAIIDVRATEHAAGMTAMKTATNNAQNIIGDLTISYNRARQGAVIRGITKIVVGVAALEQSSLTSECL